MFNSSNSLPRWTSCALVVRKARFIVWTLALSLAPLGASSQEPPSLRSADLISLEVGVLREWPPHFLLDEDGQPAGFAVDVFEAVALKAGFQPHYRIFETFAEIQEALHAGEIDATPNMGILEERSDLEFTAPVATFHVSLFVRTSSVGIHGLGDLAGKSIGVVKSNVGALLLRGTVEEPVNQVEFENVQEALFRLLSGELDALIYPASVVWHLARSAEIDHHIRELRPPLIEIKRAIAVAPGRNELLKKLDPVVREFVRTPAYRAIYKKWHSPPQPLLTLPRALWAFGLLIVFFGALRYRTLQRHSRELESRETTFRSLAESLVECVLIVDKSHSIQYVNGQCRSVFRRPQKDLVGRDVRELLGHESSALEELSEKDDVQLTRLDGSVFAAEMEVSPYLRAGRQEGWILTVQDVTAKRRIEEQIRFQARLLEMVQQAVIATDLEGKVLFWNRYAEELYGWKRREAIGRSVIELTLPAKDRDATAPIMEKLRQGETWSGEFLAARRDGTSFPAFTSSAPISNPAGNLIGIVAVSSDLSEQKRLEEQLRQSQKMEAVGRLAGGIAHDFNNILQAVVGYNQLLLNSLPADDETYEFATEIAKASRRAAGIVGQLVAFARSQSMTPKLLDLNAAIEERIPTLRRLAGEEIQLVWRPAPHVWPVKLDPSQLDQVLSNLVVNGRDAIDGPGEITIETRQTECASPRAPREANSAPAAYVSLTVQDNGRGMDPATISSIYEPFFTTKPIWKGVGLGLATVFGIVQQNGGYIDVDSAPEKGSVFDVRLPRACEELPVKALPPAARTAGGKGTILVVDDEGPILKLACRVLESVGYRALQAPGPAEAIGILRERPKEIDLVITDVNLPGMNGHELWRKLAKMKPGLRRLFMSGGASSGPDDGIEGAKKTHFIDKPFSAQQLTDAVREILKHPEPPSD